jgi:signal transduction histidine kinase
MRFSAASLRSRISLLAVLTCILLAGAAAAFLILQRHSESSTLASAEGHLGTLARTLAQDSVGRSAWEQHHGASPAIQAPQAEGSSQLLALMTSSVLQHEPGIEGGFYATAEDDLLGYAFPTHPGPGTKTDIPAHERPAITNLARRAAQSGQVETLRFTSARDATVFAAYPIVVNGQCLGAAWMMQRMPGLNAGTNARLLGGMIAVALGALACAIIAFLVVREVQSAVFAIAGYLGGLGGDLSIPRPQPLKLAEFESVLNEIDRLAATLRDKKENERQLEAKLRHQDRLSSLGQFAAGIAHEIRNPLATIRLRIQMSQRSIADAGLERNSEIALEEIARLDTMIERLLYFSRPIRLERDRVDLNELCRGVMESHSAAAETHRIAMECAASSPAFAMADRNQIRQVLDNMMTNAIDAVAEAEGTRWIRCSASASEKEVKIRIEDSGPGFAPEVAAHAFDPFYTTKAKGTGLGLSIAWEILRAHDGQLVVGNRAGGGAVVTMYLPASETAAPDQSISIGVGGDPFHD